MCICLTSTNHQSQGDEVPRIVANHLHEIKVLQKNGTEFGKECIHAKGEEKKMRYTTLVKQIGVAKNMVAKLSKDVNQLLRTSDMVRLNQKRVKLEVERLDTIIFEVPIVYTLDMSCHTLFSISHKLFIFLCCALPEDDQRPTRFIVNKTFNASTCPFETCQRKISCCNETSCERT